MNRLKLNKSSMYILLLYLGVTGLISSELVEDYIGFDTPISGHRHTLKSLKAPLTDEDEQKCLFFLQSKFPEETIASGRVRQNDLADWMLQRAEHVNATTAVLLEVIYDESADLLWREFCIQKLALAVSQSELSESLEVRCCETLEEMAGDIRISFSGTALLGLYRLHESDPGGLSSEKIRLLAENVLNAPGFPTANKVTALQIAGLLDSPYALEYARGIIQSDKNIQLRISAIALLAQKGHAGDLEVLRSLHDHKDLRLRQSSRTAVTRLENKTTTH